MPPCGGGPPRGGPGRKTKRGPPPPPAAPRGGEDPPRPPRPGGGEDRPLHLGVVDTDRAAAELLAVPDDVVGLRPRRARVLEVKVARRRRERVVHRVPALPLLVPLHQRPVDDPDQPVLVLVDQAELLA